MSEKPELLPWTMTKGDFGHWNAHLNGKLVYSAKKEWVQKYVDDRNEAFEMGRRSSAPQAQGAGKVTGEDVIAVINAIFDREQDQHRESCENGCDFAPEGVEEPEHEWCDALQELEDACSEIRGLIRHYGPEVQVALNSTQERDLEAEGALLRSYRLSLGLSLSEAAAKMDTTHVHLGEIERGLKPAESIGEWFKFNPYDPTASCEKAQGGEKP